MGMVLACVIGWHREHFLGDIVAVGREGGVRVSRYEIKGSFFIPPIIHRLSWRRVPKPPPRYYMAKAGVARCTRWWRANLVSCKKYRR